MTTKIHRVWSTPIKKIKWNLFLAKFLKVEPVERVHEDRPQPVCTDNHHDWKGVLLETWKWEKNNGAKKLDLPQFIFNFKTLSDVYDASWEIFGSNREVNKVNIRLHVFKPKTICPTDVV